MLNAFCDKLIPCSFAKILARSCENVFCKLMQNLYNSTGTTPISEQAKKPFKILIAVVFTFARPC